MSNSKVRQILDELKNHAPFTIGGALTGLVFMLIFQRYGQETAEKLFVIFHPLHVVLSAMVTSSLFLLHRKVSNFFLILVIGYVGSIGIATLSDCILPYFGETILGAAIPTHAALHEHEHEETLEPADEHNDFEHNQAVHEEHEHEHRPHLHLGFIEEWYLVNPAALIGVLIAYFMPQTKMPHAMHILISTWASASHMLMNTAAAMSVTLLLGMFIVLFLAVWLPCCVSDIIFPMLFIKDGEAHIGHTCVLCGKKDQHDSAE